MGVSEPAQYTISLVVNVSLDSLLQVKHVVLAQLLPGLPLNGLPQTGQS